MSASEVLRRIIGTLGHSGIAYMLVGSFAAAPYGLTRSTHDIDIVIDPTAQQLQNFIRCLGDDYYANQNDILAALASRDMFNVIDQTRPSAGRSICSYPQTALTVTRRSGGAVWSTCQNCRTCPLLWPARKTLSSPNWNGPGWDSRPGRLKMSPPFCSGAGRLWTVPICDTG